MFLPVLLSYVAAVPLATPALPPLTSPEVQSQILDVESALEKGDFVAAQQLAAHLPKANFSLVWDDRKVPVPLRADFVSARNQAMRRWQSFLRGKATVATTGQVRVSFESTLANDSELGVPASVVLFAAKKSPRMEGVIGLRRGTPSLPATPVGVYNDVLYTIGAYLGLARNKVVGAAMTPTPQLANAGHGISPVEMIAARQIVKVSDFLRNCAATKVRVKAGVPSAFIDPQKFEGEAVQGDEVEMSVQITNRGDAPLSYRVEGDCGCVTPEPPGQVAPNATTVVHVKLDTKEFASAMNRRLTVFTSDSNEPVRVIPVTLRVTPQYQFISPLGASIDLPEKGLAFDVFLALADGIDLSVVNAQITGLDGKVRYERWTGKMADPERDEPIKSRRGYRFHIEVPGTLPTGRSFFGLNVLTNSQEFRTISFPMAAQRGILALPEELFLGELGKTARVSNVSISRAKGPIKILGASIDARSISVKVLAGKNESEQRIQVIYDGTAPSGELSATITVRLDDPKQPVLLIPVTGTVR